MDAGALGQCCQTLIEAEALMLNGIDHVLLTANLATKETIAIAIVDAVARKLGRPVADDPSKPQETP